MKASEVKVGMRVTTSGFSGAITAVCEWSRSDSEVLVEVRLPSGAKCVSCHELQVSQQSRNAGDSSLKKTTADTGESPGSSGPEAKQGAGAYPGGLPDYETWYSDWMKKLAKWHTKSDLEKKLVGVSYQLPKAARSHLAAIRKTSSMQGNSQRRAQAKNCVAAYGEEKIAINGALEIHDLFPQHARQEVA